VSVGSAQLREVELPVFGMPESMPEIPARTYAARVAALRERAAAHGLDDVLIWAGGTLWEIIHRQIGDRFYGVRLNPGHQLSLDEWVNSPVSSGSTIELRSGMAFQVDIIPATGTDYFTTNIEDGIALADHTLRDAFAAAYPSAWARVQARRTFMADALGIELHPDVLPFSNIPAFLPPFLLRPDRLMTIDR
jgi:hypothetical protein